jgi:hypothetical protein
MASFKKDDKSNPSNHRPVSLLCFVGKVMERVIYKHIYNYILEHSLLYQSGLLKGHSTDYQVLEIYHNVCQNLYKELSTIIIFCDISKAVDKVWCVGLKYKSCERTEYLVRFWTGSSTTSATDSKFVCFYK